MNFSPAKLLQFSRVFLRPAEVNYLILYVTSICNQKCSFCFYADSLNAEWGHGLSAEQLEQVSQSLPNCIHLTITGGEPFVRKDLPDIVRYFCNNSGTINITFPTNGSLPLQTASMLEQMLAENPQCVFRMALSVDGLPEVHNRLRGMNGAYEKAADTFARVKQLQKRHRNLVLVINSVASGLNKDHLKEFIDHAMEHLWCDDHSLLLARGNTKETEAKNISPAEYHALVQYLEKKKSQKRQAETLYKKLLKHIETRTRELTDKTYSENKYMMPCTAGRKLLVLYDNGDLTPCEIIDTLQHTADARQQYGNFVMGNLHENNYNIQQVLDSGKAKSIQQYIRDSKCYCTFECAIAASLTLDSKNIKHLIKPIKNAKI